MKNVLLEKLFQLFQPKFLLKADVFPAFQIQNEKIDLFPAFPVFSVREATLRSFCRGKSLPNQARSQKRFHEHYLSGGHNGNGNWEITIIDHAETVKALVKEEK